MKWQRIQNGTYLSGKPFWSDRWKCAPDEHTTIFIEKESGKYAGREYVRITPEYHVNYRGQLHGWELDKFDKTSRTLDDAKKLAKDLHAENLALAHKLKGDE